MSKTRNQRRRNFWERIEAILTAILVLIALVGLLLAGSLWSRIQQTTRIIEERRQQYPVIHVENYLPEDFDPEAYQDACWRYAVENDLIFPHFIVEGGE